MEEPTEPYISEPDPSPEEEAAPTYIIDRLKQIFCDKCGTSRLNLIGIIDDYEILLRCTQCDILIEYIINLKVKKKKEVSYAG